jgi:hypothetical protein
LVTHLPTKKTWQGRSVNLPETIIEKVCFNMEGTTESHGISRSTMVNHRPFLGLRSNSLGLRQVFSGPALRQDIFGEPSRDGGLWRRSPFKWCPVTQYVS